MGKIRISIPAEITKVSKWNEGHDEFLAQAAFGEDRVSEIGYTEKSTKKKLENKINEMVARGIRDDANYQRRYIGTNAGDIFIVSFSGDNWQYVIAGKGRKHACATISGDTFDETVEAARRHAEQCFDGIAWEHN